VRAALALSDGERVDMTGVCLTARDSREFTRLQWLRQFDFYPVGCEAIPCRMWSLPRRAGSDVRIC
jgi:hypothetical protein